MGRYTTSQAYSDAHSSVAKVSYAAATGSKPQAAPGAGGGVSAALRTEKVNNVSGTQAGAGSGTFHTYRHQRYREMLRVEAMEADAEKRGKDTVFQARRSQQQEELEARAAARAQKRQRKKRRQRERQAQRSEAAAA